MSNGAHATRRPWSACIAARRKDRTARESASLLPRQSTSRTAPRKRRRNGAQTGRACRPETAPGTGARAAADVSIGTPVARGRRNRRRWDVCRHRRKGRGCARGKEGGWSCSPRRRRVGRSSKPVPQMSSGRPAAAASASPPAPSGYSRADAAVRLRLAAPFGLAAALLIAVIVADHRLPIGRVPNPAPFSGSRADRAAGQSASPASTSRTVQKGDSRGRSIALSRAKERWIPGGRTFSAA